MSTKQICDYCGTAFPVGEKYHTIETDRDGSSGPEGYHKSDMCAVCWASPVILSELRRTRTRKPKAKVGRPKGSKKRTAGIEIDADSKISLGLEDANGTPNL